MMGCKVAIGDITLWSVVIPAPSGWELCEGQSLDTAVYPDLFAVIGYTYGGSGSTFNLPDLRGRR
jgi:microcystin-dependent protein